MKMKFNHSRILFGGDIHGQFKTLIYEINRNNISDALIVILGDISLGFNKYNYYINMFNYMQKKLEAKNNTVIFLRGNHDDPKYFNTQIIPIYNNIKIASDYSIISNNDINYLLIGGGISVDRYSRLATRQYSNKTDIYWIDEDVHFNDNDLELIENEKFSVILTHIAPSHVWPHQKPGIDYWLDFDKKLDDDENDSRQKLKNFYDIIKERNNITHWFFGHYHEDHVEIIDNIEFRCVDKNKLYELY